MSSTTTEPTGAAPPRRRFLADSRIVKGCRYVVSHTGMDRFFIRFIAILVVLFGLYNPTRYSYVNWILPGGSAPVKVWIGDNLWEILIGILFISAFVYLARTTHKALGPTGTLLVAAVLLALFGLFAWNFDVNWSGSILITIVQIGLAVLLTVGLLAANINRRISGQITTVQAGPIQTHEIGGGGHHGG